MGLVLGAGGIVGLGYHAGALAALENDLRWDPRRADIIVGSSAGSVIATLLRSGISALDLAAWCAGPSDDPLLVRVRQMEEGLPPLRIGDLLRHWPSSGLAFWPRVLDDPRRLSFPALSSLLPAGNHATTGYRMQMQRLLGEGWPNGLWLCATRRDTGQRTVFGMPDSLRVPLSDAVTASCAIPAYFEPVVMDGKEFVDGGIRSSTNADLLSSSLLDVVIVIAPLSTRDPRSREWSAPMRLWARRHVRQEVAALRAAGTKVLLLEPGGAVRHEMGLDPMGKDRSERVMRASFFDTGRLVSSEAVRETIGEVLERAAHRPAAAESAA